MFRLVLRLRTVTLALPDRLNGKGQDRGGDCEISAALAPTSLLGEAPGPDAGASLVLAARASHLLDWWLACGAPLGLIGTTRGPGLDEER